ncbi:phage major capsid protein [Gordonia iterans]
MAISANYNRAFLPEAVQQLIEQPLRDESVAFTVSTVVSTNERSARFPITLADPTAAWTPEGEEITPSDSTVDELEVVPKKVSALSVISNELAEDSTPGAAGVVGRGIVADLIRRVDAAFFADTTPNGPSGIGSIAHQDVTADSFTNLDPFAEAISKAAGVGATITSFVTSPATALDLARLKDETGSNRPLLQPDPTKPGRNIVLGVPLLTSPTITTGVVWAIPTERVFTVLREGTSLEADRSAFFTSDRVAVRGKARVAFGFPHAAAVVRIGPAIGS